MDKVFCRISGWNQVNLDKTNANRHRLQICTFSLSITPNVIPNTNLAPTPLPLPAHSPFLTHFDRMYQAENTLSTPALAPWVKELPPVRDNRKQLASGEIIPLLDQHMYPAGGVTKVKRSRRREKEAYLRTGVIIVPKNIARTSVGASGSARAGVVDRDSCRGGGDDLLNKLTLFAGRRKSVVGDGTADDTNALLGTGDALRGHRDSFGTGGNISGTAAGDKDSECSREYSAYDGESARESILLAKIPLTEDKEFSPHDILHVHHGTKLSELARAEHRGKAFGRADDTHNEITQGHQDDTDIRLAADIAEVVAATAVAERLVALAVRQTCNADQCAPAASIGSASTAGGTGESWSPLDMEASRAHRAVENLHGVEGREAKATCQILKITVDDAVLSGEGQRGEEGAWLADVGTAAVFPSCNSAVVTSSVSVIDMGEMPS